MYPGVKAIKGPPLITWPHVHLRYDRKVKKSSAEKMKGPISSRLVNNKPLLTTVAFPHCLFSRALVVVVYTRFYMISIDFSRYKSMSKLNFTKYANGYCKSCD